MTNESVTSKMAFYKRTKRKKVVRIVREKYLHNVKNYGFKHGGEKELSQSKLKELIINSKKKHLIVLDTNIALHQIDLLEFRCEGFSNIIILQTVLQELRHLNLAVFRRLSTIMLDKSRSFIFYPNEVNVNSATYRLKDETPNDANDRAIRIASLIFHDALEDVGETILLTNDEDNRKKAHSENLRAMSIHQYASQHLKEYPEVLDLLATDARFAESATISINNKKEANNLQVIYDHHLSMSELSTGLRSKKLFRGVLRCSRDDWQDCYVVVHDGNNRKSIMVKGLLNVNRAIDGDVVAIQILDNDPDVAKEIEKTTTESDGTARVVGAGTLEPSTAVIEGTAVAATIYGKVVGIIRRNWRQYAGSLYIDSQTISGNSNGNNNGSISDKDSNGNRDTSISSDKEGEIVEMEAETVTFVPVSNRIPRIHITTRRLNDLQDQRLLVTIDAWPVTSYLPLGHYVRSLGKDGEKDVETAVLLHEFDVPHEAFSPEVMKCLPNDDWCITEEMLKDSDRVDFRKLPIVSIDPPGCKDIDDALHCITLPNGNFQLGVHIADVTHFVLPDTAIDKEAAHRSTSTYLVERRLDMLPGLLTTELCSLRSGEDHLSFSVLWEMTPDAQIVDASFHKSVIHSAASLTYDEAQAILDSNEKYGHENTSKESGVNLSVMGLARIARILRKRRIEHGALTLASPEVRFRLDSETQNPTDVGAYALKEANAVVEEFMLLANITVSKKILRHFPTLGVLRRHPSPSKEQFTPLLNAARAVGVNLDISSSKALADSLDAAVRTGDPYFNKLLRMLSTRCMMPAQYFCSGEIPSDQWWHYGLAAPVYTHFTSPIRRYADVVVHRLLAAAINVCPLPASYADRSKQQELCTHMNRRHRAAQHASRASTNLHTVLYFRIRPSIVDGYVLSIGLETITVLIPEYAIEGPVSLVSLASNLGPITLNEITQTISINSSNAYNGSGKRKSGDSDNVLFKIQVLEKVQVSVTVVESRLGGGDRRLRLSLVHQGQTYADTEDGDMDQNVDVQEQTKTKGGKDEAEAEDRLALSIFDYDNKESGQKKKKRKKSKK